MAKYIIAPLPHWVLTDLQPAIYDNESVTAVQMVAKLYAKMQELITTYNEFADQVNAEMDKQDVKIQKAIGYMKDHIIETASALFEQAITDHTITADLKVSYDPEDESLALSIYADGGE